MQPFLQPFGEGCRQYRVLSYVEDLAISSSPGTFPKDCLVLRKVLLTGEDGGCECFAGLIMEFPDDANDEHIHEMITAAANEVGFWACGTDHSSHIVIHDCPDVIKWKWVD